MVVEQPSSGSEHAEFVGDKVQLLRQRLEMKVIGVINTSERRDTGRTIFGMSERGQINNLIVVPVGERCQRTEVRQIELHVRAKPIIPQRCGVDINAQATVIGSVVWQASKLTPTLG